MGREIKFRAWDGADMIYFDLNLCNKESGDWFDNTIWRNPVMQYTGLKDKNGVEIYEGDIVNCWNQDGIQFPTGCVTWLSDGACFFIDSECDYGLFEFSYAGCTEVIGNIHENPELLNK